MRNGGFWRSSQHVLVTSRPLAAGEAFRAALVGTSGRSWRSGHAGPLQVPGLQVRYARAFQRSCSVEKRSTSSSSTTAFSAVAVAGPATHQSAPGKPAEA
jgi:hypothetical protein